MGCGFGQRTHKNEDLVGGCVREHLQVVRRVLVVTRNEDGHQLVEEVLARRVVREQSVSVDVVKLALARMGEAEDELVIVLGGVEAEQVVKPLFDWVSLSVPDWLVQTGLHEGAATKVGCGTACLLMGHSRLVLLSEAVE